MSEVKGVTVTSETGEKGFIPCVPGKTFDGYHSFDELYAHRCMLFAALMKSHPWRSWRSLRHDDGSQWDGWFIAGMSLPIALPDVGMPITYHLPIHLWDLLEGVPELERAPQWDGHSAADVLQRLEDWVKGWMILPVR